ncbi:MAG: energy-coupling factor transporter transmembrane protein EcfT, partial [Clostridia bacterium]|nr:energy-coupling factor transporter transmembrane protein EcfT [Clostridia bacterium]
FVLNLFFKTGENVIFSLGFWTFTWEAVWQSIFITIRIILRVTVASMLTLTTSPIALTDGIERLLQPLRVFHFPAHELAMMMTIALRFIPTLIEESDKIMKAQLSRGADLESGNLFARVKSMVPILIPLFVSSFRKADELATAMESRCYHGGDGLTRLHSQRYGKVDAVAGLLTLAFFAATLIVFIVF